MDLVLRILCFLGILIFAGAEIGVAAAQAEKPLPSFNRVVHEWALTFKQVEAFTRQTTLDSDLADRYQQSLAEIEHLGNRFLVDAQARLKLLAQLTEALGPAPGEGAEPEPAALAAKRKAYGEEIGFYRARISETTLAVTRAGLLAAAISSKSRKVLLGSLVTQYPLPFLPATIKTAVPELGARLRAIAHLPVAWWDGLTPKLRQDLPFKHVIIVALLAGLAGWIGRHYLLRYFGRNRALTNPSYARRFIAAIAEGAARGIIPALILGGIMWRTLSPDGYISGEFARFVVASCSALILIVLAAVLPRAVLAPYSPVWQLAPVDPRNGKAICRLINFLAVFLAIDIILPDAAKVSASPELVSFYNMVLGSLSGVVLLLLMRGRLWKQTGPDDDREAETAMPPPPAPRPSRSFWASLRAVIALCSVAGIAAALLGYSELSFYLIKNLLFSGTVIGGLFLLRGLLRESIRFAVGSRWAIERLGLEHPTRQGIKFWCRAALELVLFVIGAVAIAPIWGIPIKELTRWLGGFLQGFKIGSVTISVVDIAVAFGVFLIGLVITRILQRALTDQVLPQTQLETGLQNSLSSGFGYVGLLIAAALAISVVGIDLSNIALIAGALSVGIGFGLQNIVNNFVSGLILLIERPVKVGDWVVVGSNEGFIQKINVRATELLTFQRASVIIPNADLLSSAVTNWTHKDRHGRIEVAVGVAYGSDTSRVREILLLCAQEDDRIFRYPAPYVLFKDFGNSSLDFELRCFTGDVLSRLMIASDLRFLIDQRFREQGVEIPFPQRVVHMAGARDGQPEFSPLEEDLDGKA
ncbi:MAG: mechanosensitive ion channel [Proteobacteria bacterium]|nr:mechanosensitive ion channel [Pseudomonadota bacterium]